MGWVRSRSELVHDNNELVLISLFLATLINVFFLKLLQHLSAAIRHFTCKGICLCNILSATGQNARSGLCSCR